MLVRKRLPQEQKQALGEPGKPYSSPPLFFSPPPSLSLRRKPLEACEVRVVRVCEGALSGHPVSLSQHSQKLTQLLSVPELVHPRWPLVPIPQLS